MGDALKQSLESIAVANGKLSVLDDQVSAAIKRIEELLRERVAIRFATVVRLSNQDEMLLAFAKLDGRWGLVLEAGESRAFLASAPRHLRSEVFTAGYVGKLIREAAGQLETQIAEREDAIGEAARIVAALGGGEPIKERRRG